MFPSTDDYAPQIDGRITPHHTSAQAEKDVVINKTGAAIPTSEAWAPSGVGDCTVDEAIDKVGFGKGQGWLLLAAGVACAADSVELAGISFAIITTMECDLELDSGRKGWIISATFLGMMVGSTFWGTLSDKYGRKKILISALLVNFIGGVACASAFSFIELVILRTICGIGIGGSIPILFSYFAEFLPSTSRGQSITLLASFWMVGSILVAIFAFAIIGPVECDRYSNLTLAEQCSLRSADRCEIYRTFNYDVAAWRLFLLSTSAPCLLAIVLLAFQLESPRWLALKGRYTKAERVLRKLARRNRKASAYNIKIRKEDAPSLAGNSNDCEQALLPKEAPKALSTRDTLRELFGKELRARMLLLCGLWFFLSFGFYGFTLWLPSYFKAGGVDDDSNIYLVSIYIGLSNLPGNAFSYFIVDRIGRKWTIVLSLILSGGSVFVVLGIKTATGVVAFSCVFAAVSVSAWNALDVWVVELFPTQVRSTAFGIQSAIGRIGSIASSIIFGLFSDDQPTLPMLATGISLLLAAVHCILLPNTGRGTVMH